MWTSKSLSNLNSRCNKKLSWFLLYCQAYCTEIHSMFVYCFCSPKLIKYYPVKTHTKFWYLNNHHIHPFIHSMNTHSSLYTSDTASAQSELKRLEDKTRVYQSTWQSLIIVGLSKTVICPKLHLFVWPEWAVIINLCL